jgi:cytidylate kinase
MEARRARDGDGMFTPGVSKVDRARRRAQEKMEKEEERVEELEETLEIVERWMTESPKWAATVDGIKKRKYVLALDSLKLLIVERIFELTKMNQSQTGKWYESLER